VAAGGVDERRHDLVGGPHGPLGESRPGQCPGRPRPDSPGGTAVRGDPGLADAHHADRQLATSGDKLRARDARPNPIQAARAAPKPSTIERDALAARPAYSAGLPGPSSRASSVRSYPAQESGRYDRVTDSSRWDRPAATHHQSRSGLPFGNRVPEPEPANELQYVDVE
jgi:hypothetical protein